MSPGAGAGQSSGRAQLTFGLLAACCIEMFTGKRAFGGDNVPDTFAAIVADGAGLERAAREHSNRDSTSAATGIDQESKEPSRGCIDGAARDRGRVDTA